MGRMGTTAPQDAAAPEPLGEPAKARRSILAAARQVALRDGVEVMSLAAVAAEAGCTSNAIYALFSSKDDLLLAVVADDLTALAQAMRSKSAAPAKLSDESHDASPVTMQNTAEPQVIAAAPAESDPAIVSRFPVVQPRRDQARPVQADSAETLEAIAKLQETVSRLEARPVDSWLERRLREFERSLDTLQGLHAERGVTDNGFEVRLVELQHGIGELEQRQKSAADDAVRCLMQRLDASEKRLLELVSNIEADSSGLARRLTALENTTPTGASFVVETAAEASRPEVATAEPETSKAAPAAESSTLSGGASYLAAARRSAQVAALTDESVAQRATKQKTNPTMLYLAGGSLVLFVAMLGASSLLLRNNALNGAAVHPVAHARALPAPRRVAAKTVPPIPHDERQSRLRKLAEAGNPAAETLVGLEYLDGGGLQKNDASALAWLTRAAAKGQAVAQYSLGQLWAEGRGVSADQVQAFQWFGSAALRGNRKAMHSLAVAYAQGLGTTANLSEAARWFERAATLGSVNSQFDLAVLYERGLGVTQNLSTAYKWYAIAAAQGDRESQARVSALSSTLLPGDLESARVAALSFHPDPMDASANVAPSLSELP